MRLRVIDRILIALSGLILLALTAWVALDLTGFVQPVSEVTGWLFNADEWRWIVLAGCVLAALLGVYEVSVLFRRRKGKRGFIAQKSENGEIAISVKTIETLVTKCAQKHGEIAVQSVSVDELRSGLLIKLRASLPSGMNIPLAVGTLQKQIKQYITACSGVDVSEVRVKVDSTDKAASGSPYAVSDEQSALPVEQPEPAPIPAEAVTPVEVPAEVPEMPSDERELLTHQRLFSTVEEPAMVPEPPAPEEPMLPSEAEQAMADAAEEAAEANADWAEQNEARWDAVAAEVEAQEAQWDAAAAQAEANEADEPEAPAETETKEE